MTFLHSVLASQFASSFCEGKEDGSYVDYCITISEYGEHEHNKTKYFVQSIR